MNKSELETQAEKICVYNDQIHRDCFVNGYVTGALKREQQIADIKANCDLAIEGRDIKIKELEQQIEKMKKYIKSCWIEENLNDYSSYITNTSDEFIDLVKELNEEIRNGR